LQKHKNVQPSSKVDHKDWVVLLGNKAKVQNEQAKKQETSEEWTEFSLSHTPFGMQERDGRYQEHS